MHDRALWLCVIFYDFTDLALFLWVYLKTTNLCLLQDNFCLSSSSTSSQKPMVSLRPRFTWILDGFKMDGYCWMTQVWYKPLKLFFKIQCQNVVAYGFEWENARQYISQKLLNFIEQNILSTKWVHVDLWVSITDLCARSLWFHHIKTSVT